MLNGAFLCYTLENKSKAIPCGYYRVENGKSPKFKRELPLIYNKDVKAERGIRIHCGNTWQDTAACILVGMDVIGERLKESKVAETMVTLVCRNNEELLVSEV